MANSTPAAARLAVDHHWRVVHADRAARALYERDDAIDGALAPALFGPRWLGHDEAAALAALDQTGRWAVDTEHVTTSGRLRVRIEAHAWFDRAPRLGGLDLSVAPRFGISAPRRDVDDRVAVAMSDVSRAPAPSDDTSQAVQLEWRSTDIVDVARARRWVRDLLGGVPEPLVQDAMVCTSELLTNAVLHAVPPIRLRVHRDDVNLRIEMDDSSSQQLPHIRSPDVDGGRGLRIIDALASTWGTTTWSWGKTTWADLSLDDQRTVG